MSRTHARSGTVRRDTRDWIGRAIGVIAVIGIGVLIGLQYVTPDKRVIAVLAAVLIFGVAWRLDTVSGIGVLLVTLPFPRGTVFGNTNLALILLLLVVWLLRFTTRTAPAPQRTALDAPLACVLIMFLVSFYNVKPEEFGLAFQNTVLFLSAVFFYYLIVNNVRTTRDLRRFLSIQAIAILIVLVVSTIELVSPSTVLIPGWIDFRHVYAQGAELHDLRIGGPFFDFELLAEYCALGFCLFLFLFRQAGSIGARTFNGFMMAYCLFILAATQTRGGVLALGFAILYLLFLVRKRLQIVSLTILAAGATTALAVMEFVVSNFTHSGSVFNRITGTQFKNGMPESRADVWPDAVNRMMYHPLIGWGPHYASMTGLHLWFWPHDLYLYIANIIGLIGLSFFLWLFWRLWRLSTPTTDDLAHHDFTRAYLLIAHVQLALLLVDEIKIEFLRNPIYQYQPWILIAGIVAAERIQREETAARSAVMARAA